MNLLNMNIGKNGAWIVTDIKTITYNGPEFTEEELLRMNNLWRTKGYYTSREFYQPDEIDMQLSTLMLAILYYGLRQLLQMKKEKRKFISIVLTSIPDLSES